VSESRWNKGRELHEKNNSLLQPNKQTAHWKNKSFNVAQARRRSWKPVLSQLGDWLKAQSEVK